MQSPVATIVTAGRNDNYGERLLERVVAHCDSVDAFSAGFGQPLEHLIVDWNPPRDRPQLADVLPAPRSPLLVRRFILAAGSAVEEACERAKHGFVEGIAKNVGIRRARGQFVIVTNSDDILPYELGVATASWLSWPLSEETFARCDRLDIHFLRDEPIPFSLDLKLSCARATALHGRDGSTSVVGMSEQEIARLATSPNEGDDVHSGWFLSKSFVTDPARYLHSNASGDGLLIARARLEDAGGYCEALNISTHLDSLLLGRLFGMGMHQAILQFPAVVVHIEHDRLAGYGTGSIPWASVEDLFASLCLGGENPGQPPDWGFDSCQFPEVILEVAS